MWHIPLLVVLGALAMVMAVQYADAQEPDPIVEIRDIRRDGAGVSIDITVYSNAGIKFHFINPGSDPGGFGGSYRPGNHSLFVNIRNGLHEYFFAVPGFLGELRNRDDTVAAFYLHPNNTWWLNSEPVFNTSNHTGHTVTVGEQFSFTLNATDEDGHRLRYSSRHGGVEISGSTLRWTPDAGDYNSGLPTRITVSTSDNFGGVASADLEVTVLPAVSFDPPDPLAVVEGQPTTIDMEPYITTSPPDLARRLTLTSTSQQGHVGISGTSITYTPPPGTTSDSFDIRLDVDDVNVTRRINVTTIELPTVTAVLDAVRVHPDRTIVIPVLDNDIVDPEDAELRITDIIHYRLNEYGFPTRDGDTSISDDLMSIIYEADNWYERTDRFNYTVTATGGVTSTASVVVRLSAETTQSPVAEDFSFDIARGNTVDVVIGGYAYDFNEPADQLGISVGDASKGTPGVSGSVITYEPSAGTSGVDRFEYNATDSGNRTGTGTVKVIISPNVPPTADNASRSVDSGGSVSIDLSGLTGDPNDDPLELSIATGPQYGNATIAGTALTYEADRHPGAYTDTIVYAATDTEEATTHGTISISLTFTVSLRTAPDMDIGVWGKTTYIPVLENDIILPEDTAVTINIANSGSMGTAAVHNATHISYMPRNGTSGTDIVTYTISAMGSTSDPANITLPIFEVTPNMPPVTKAVTRTAVSGGPAISVDLSEDDRISDDRDDIANLTVTIPVQPEAGVAELVGDTIIRYTPRAAGTHMVNYIVTDSEGLSADGTITVMVSATATKMNPVAPDINMTTPEDTNLAFPTPAFDPDGGDVRVVHATDGDIGMTVNNATFITYMPGLNLHGNDTMTYTVIDNEGETATGTINIIVTSVNDPPVLDHIRNYRVLINTPINFTVVATDPDGDDLIYFMENDWPRMSLGRTDGLFTWTPFDDKNRNAVFQIWATDDLDNLYSTDHSDYQEVTINVLLPADGPVNQPPTIDPIDNQTVLEGETLRVRPNATDMDRDLLEYELTGDPLPDEAAFDDTTGHLDWTPGESDGGTSHDVAIEVYDGYVTVHQNFTITVEESNQNPVFNSVPARRATVGETLTVQITATDADVPEQMLEFGIFGDDLGAMLSNTTSFGTTLSWTPNSTHIPSQTITILVQDDFDPRGFARLPISIAVADVPNTAPEAANFEITVAPSQTVPTDLAAGMHINDAEQNATTLVVTVNETPAPAKGNASASETTITYTANADAVGTDTVSYTVTDDGDLTATAMMTVRIEIPDEPMSAPRAESFSANTTEDMEVTIAPVISDPDGGAVTITAVGNGRSGTANHTVNTVTYTPNPDFNGEDTITYTVTDDEGETATGRIDITVTPVNDPPVIGALRDWNINATDLFRLEIDADDVDEDTLIFNLTEGPSDATLNQQGFFLWRPTNDDIADHTVTITVSDGQGGVDTETITIRVLPAGQATGQPPALDPIGDWTVSEDQTLQIRPRADDPDRDTLTYSLTGDMLPDTATFDNTTGHLDWTPGEEDGGTSHNITITVSDGKNGTDSESITITVRETNENPVITEVSQQTAVVGQQLTVRITANDTDIPPQTLSYRITGDDLGADISGNVVTWTPDSSHVGSRSITVLVEDDYDPKGSATVVIPVTVSSTGQTRDPVAPDILINAELFFPSAVTPAVTDPDGDNVTITSVTGATLGILDTSMLPQISYTPNQTGIDRLNYVASDLKGGTDTGTITIFINPEGNARPALDHIYNTGGRVGVDLEFTATADDSDDTSFTFDIANAPDGASITPGGDFSWRPAESQNGTHTVTFIVYDDSGGADWQHVTINVLRADETNLPPIPQDIDAGVVLGGGRGFQPDISDPENDGTEIVRVYDSSLGDVDRSFTSQGIIVYVAGVLGDDEVIYTVSDGRGGFANGTLSITVEEPANVRPLIEFVGDKSVNAGDELTFTVDADDLDGLVVDFGLEGDTQGPSMSPLGVFSWTPTANDVGRHEFTILVFDDAGENSTVTITVTVRPEGYRNSPPVAPDVVIMTPQDVLSIVRPTLTDPDEGDPVRISETGQTTKGSILSGFLRAGIIIYLPNQGETGTETIPYTVSDSSDDTDTATINVFISARGNTDPILGSIDFRNINAGDPLAFDLEAEDPDGDTISYQTVGAPDGVEISPEGAFSWTPTAADVGNHTFAVIAYDDRGGADSKSAVIRVLPAGTANQAPNAPDSTVTVAPGGSIVITPAISDPDGDRVTIDDAVASGTGVVIPSEDSINYIHVATTPTETITYTVIDARGATSTGTITVTVQ